MEQQIFKIWAYMQYKKEIDAVLQILDDDRLKDIKDVLLMKQDDALKISEDIDKKLWDIKKFYSEAWDQYLTRHYYPARFLSHLYFSVEIEKSMKHKKAVNLLKAKIYEKGYTYNDFYETLTYNKNHTFYKMTNQEEVNRIQKWVKETLLKLKEVL